MNVHVISHTHWDREWHQTYQQYRVKLVRFMDELIELLENNSEYASFLLDGQTIVLEDYLEIKPEKKTAIAKLVKEGRLRVGPWYIQPDEFIPSGESLIRNLLIGQQIANEFGQSMTIGYLPDSFGQAAQIPQVLNGFGMNDALFWRGITDEETKKTDFWWEGPDGSTVLTTHLPLGYGNGRMISSDLTENAKIVEETIQELKGKATTQNGLLMCGFDQRMAIKELPEIVEEINRHYETSEHAVKLSRLENYFDAVRTEAENLDTIKGEFRKGKDMRVHVSIASTRLDLKKKNFETQQLFEKYVEPLNSMSLLFGKTYDNQLINQGWKYILQNHAHDSICNVCTDATHKEMEMRYLYADQIGQTIQKDVLNELLENIGFDNEKGQPLVVFNTLGHRRENLVEATIQLKTEHFTLSDAEGIPIPYQVIESKQENLNDRQIEIGVKNEDQYVWTTNIRFLADVEGFGYKTYYIQEEAAEIEPAENVYEDGLFSNDFFDVEIQKDGSLSVTEKTTGRIYRDLNIFEESGNAGDEYDFSPPRKDVIITTKDSEAEISVVDNGPIVATVKVGHTLSVPVDTDVQGRSEQYKEMKVDSFVTVSRHENRIDLKTVIDNTVKNHRVRALFDTDLTTDTHVADQQFGTIRRVNDLPQTEYWQEEQWEEKYYPIYPQQKYVDVSDGHHGLAVLNKGLPQYEILNREKPDIALTLLCSTDYMGKQDLLNRPGRRSGLHVETPDSSLLGRHEMEYAIVPHSGDDIAASIGTKAEEYTASMVTVQVDRQQGQASFHDQTSFLQLEESSIAISAIKKCEQDDSMIVRVYNTTDQELPSMKAKWNTEFFTNVEIVDMNEQPLPGANERLQINHGVFVIDHIRSNEILSIKLSR